MRRVLNVAVVLFCLFLHGCCCPFFGGPSVFDAEHPYTIQMRQFRSFQHAQQLETRLESLGIDSYIIASGRNEDGGRWFQVMTGATSSVADIRDLKHTLEDKHGIKDTTIVEFTDYYEDLLVEPDPAQYLETRLQSNKPQVPAVLWEAMKLYPVSNMFNIERMTIFATPRDEEDYKRFSAGYGYVNMDLPRGISKRHLRKSCEEVSEVVLRDNLYGDRVTINVLKMRLNHEISGDVTEHFADLVLNTGRYRTEDKIPYRVSAHEKLSGYKVTIEPKRDYIRTYVILMNPSEEWVFFFQSTDKTEEEMEAIIQSVGNSDGMLSYPEFYNTFHTIPDQLLSGDMFVGFNLARLGRSYARQKNNAAWARVYVGHWSARGIFHNEEKGTWTHSVYDLMSSDRAAWNQAEYGRVTKNPTCEIYGSDGYVVSGKKWSKRKRKYYSKITEINWTHDRYTVMVNNSEHSWFGKQDLINRGNALQLNHAGAFAPPFDEEL